MAIMTTTTIRKHLFLFLGVEPKSPLFPGRADAPAMGWLLKASLLSSKGSMRRRRPRKWSTCTRWLCWQWWRVLFKSTNKSWHGSDLPQFLAKPEFWELPSHHPLPYADNDDDDYVMTSTTMTKTAMIMRTTGARGSAWACDQVWRGGGGGGQGGEVNSLSEVS